MSNFLEKEHEIRENLSMIISSLDRKSRALFVIGLCQMGDFLAGVADNLQRIDKMIDAMASEMLDTSVKNARDASDNVFKGVLAGIEMSEKKEG